MFFVRLKINKIGSILIQVMKALPQSREPLLTVKKMFCASWPSITGSREWATFELFLVTNIKKSVWLPLEVHEEPPLADFLFRCVPRLHTFEIEGA